MNIEYLQGEINNNITQYNGVRNENMRKWKSRRKYYLTKKTALKDYKLILVLNNLFLCKFIHHRLFSRTRKIIIIAGYRCICALVGSKYNTQFIYNILCVSVVLTCLTCCNEHYLDSPSIQTSSM